MIRFAVTTALAAKDLLTSHNVFPLVVTVIPSDNRIVMFSIDTREMISWAPSLAMLSAPYAKWDRNYSAAPIDQTKRSAPKDISRVPIKPFGRILGRQSAFAASMVSLATLDEDRLTVLVGCWGDMNW